MPPTAAISISESPDMPVLGLSDGQIRRPKKRPPPTTPLPERPPWCLVIGGEPLEISVPPMRTDVKRRAKKDGRP